MARPNPGAGEGKLGGKLLRMDFKAWRAFEASSRRKLPDHLLDFEASLSCEQMVQWIGAFLVEEMPEDDVADLINQVGFVGTLEAITSLLASCFGSLVENKENPPQAA